MDPQTLLPEDCKEHSAVDEGMWRSGLCVYIKLAVHKFRANGRTKY
jgi:hypothetical protein